MGEWTYGDAGDRYPVAFGEVWRAGEHILACGDLEAGHGRRLLDYAALSPDMAYVDPPYDAALATGFRTKAGQPRKVDFHAFLGTLADLLTLVSGDVYVECGNRWAETLSGEFGAHGARQSDDWAITYYRKHPSRLFRFRFKEDLPVPSPIDLNGLDDEVTPKAAIRHSCPPGGWVFDPCMGRGLTAVSAHQMGARFIGLELAPRRMAVALDRLVGSGCDAERLNVHL